MSHYDETFDWVVVGSGAGSMASALVMRSAGKSVAILEKTGLVGGTTAKSGGVIWVPANRFILAAGEADSVEAGVAYLEAVCADLPGSSREKRAAYVTQATRMIDFLVAQGIALERGSDFWPDYYDELPGGCKTSRTVVAKPFDKKQLGAWEDKLRPGFLEMKVRLDDGLKLAFVAKSWKIKALFAKIALGLARVHMKLHGWPLPVLGNYTFPAADVPPLKASVRAMGTAQLAAIRGVKLARALQLDDAAALLAALVAEAGSSQVVISSFGLREGLMFQTLSPAIRQLDPLIEGVRHTVEGQLQVPGYSEALLRWCDAIFPDETTHIRRLRHAACLLFGTGWASSPDFRAMDGEELALHGNWVGVDGPARAEMAMALHGALGGNPDTPPAILGQLASAAGLARAQSWGLAMRLAQRLSGGSPGVLAALTLTLAADGAVVLGVPGNVAGLVDAAVERRLARLAMSLGRSARIESLADVAYAPENQSGGGGRRPRA